MNFKKWLLKESPDDETRDDFNFLHATRIQRIREKNLNTARELFINLLSILKIDLNRELKSKNKSTISSVDISNQRYINYLNEKHLIDFDKKDLDLAYKILIWHWHPDRSGDQELMTAIFKAYEILSKDIEERKSYIYQRSKQTQNIKNVTASQAAERISNIINRFDSYQKIAAIITILKNMDKKYTKEIKDKCKQYVKYKDEIGNNNPLWELRELLEKLQEKKERNPKIPFTLDFILKGLVKVFIKESNKIIPTTKTMMVTMDDVLEPYNKIFKILNKIISSFSGNNFSAMHLSDYITHNFKPKRVLNTEFEIEF